MSDTASLSPQSRDEPPGAYRRQPRSDGNGRSRTGRDNEETRDRRPGGGHEDAPPGERRARLANRWIWPAVLGALAGAARLPGGAIPLASGYVVALLTAGDRPRAAAAGAAVLASMALGGDGLRWVEQALILLQAAFLAALLPERPPGALENGQAAGLGAPALDRRNRRASGPSPGGTGDGAGPKIALGHLPFLVLAGTVLLRVGML